MWLGSRGLCWWWWRHRKASWESSHSANRLINLNKRLLSQTACLHTHLSPLVPAPICQSTRHNHVCCFLMSTLMSISSLMFCCMITLIHFRSPSFSSIYLSRVSTQMYQFYVLAASRINRRRSRCS